MSDLKNQKEVAIEELNYLDDMGEKAGEILEKHFLNKEFPVSKDAPFPIELMEAGARILIDVAVVNTPLRLFHVVTLVEGHLFLLNVQDKNKNTVADVMFSCEVAPTTMTVQEILVTYKPGAILYRYEEMATEAKAVELAEANN